jgi:hypothetical protein
VQGEKNHETNGRVRNGNNVNEFAFLGYWYGGSAPKKQIGA